jgi:hypothetical protein
MLIAYTSPPRILTFSELLCLFPKAVRASFLLLALMGAITQVGETTFTIHESMSIVNQDENAA